MNSDEITKAVIEFAKIYGLGKNREYNSLHAAICSASKYDRYFGLMGVFKCEMRDERLLIQTFAGRVLLKVMPKAMESCESAIFSLLKYWDVSAEEVIYYLKVQHGKERLLSIVSCMRKGNLPERDLAVLKTIDYWLGKNE